ncbi:hypothetical protein A3C98_04355 [Candidatus Roizmanbacteria bacterium RIFCSPHIGHO2_02_FULL_37_15]|uniref:Uncharacterized protein n=1 Tax=Candidatus Roizmanbacteria bacterium RIFCSPLOWO2_01_FULL_37_16 TaxID=1802058 RepID=A0A1F7IIP2_9BACT|nr:MAG: hypothetical protein A2859_01055 [Candidatus Roizmanbacteria bacterium RIFCSPHIGHO2_01_FULL_37_16b]OGK20724.1 MAG: hypothetical protein A3C98_04355 [Candidatus Roizmanbacteria bacterium RIFCSPHIGHO2_02_FULL_37_15]OGK33315.1 MAG: hypothetical protein A3F57_05235 [Candidatus Roizmanbacteria bacterium RIFCSPHIGHO2_12_FULL_36_11]OGK43221.1 MAG: hypothetical protein A3B40_03080 [Candidatus Roizmanbacteria bacterium RIFCSPLOWO2_01_FULL_37_16]OGK57213.1 MAG: hypothetical protein A3I50_00715 [C
MTQKKLLIFAVGIVSIMIIGGVLVASRKPDQPKKMEEEILPTEVLIPTVDSSVAVDLITSSAGREVTLQIKSIPTGTESIDYELSYQTKQQGLQGVIGTIPVNINQSKLEKTLTLGTCSSGTCVYHQVVGKIRLNLRFTGDYGDKVFEKEYEI